MNPIMLNPWGTVMVHRGEHESKFVQIRLKDNTVLKLVFKEEEPIMGDLKELNSVSDVIRDYLVEERHLTELTYKGVVLKWSEHDHVTSSESVKACLSVTAVVDDVLRLLTAYGKSDRTWIHAMILNKGIVRSQYTWTNVMPNDSITTLRDWLKFVRDLLLIPHDIPIVNKMGLPGKVGVFALLSLPKRSRRTAPGYARLKEFLDVGNNHDKAHQQLYRTFIQTITGSSVVQHLDDLLVDQQNPTVQWLRRLYQQR